MAEQNHNEDQLNAEITCIRTRISNMLEEIDGLKIAATSGDAEALRRIEMLRRLVATEDGVLKSHMQLLRLQHRGMVSESTALDALVDIFRRRQQDAAAAGNGEDRRGQTTTQQQHPRPNGSRH